MAIYPVADQSMAMAGAANATPRHTANPISSAFFISFYLLNSFYSLCTD
jgi:hypothetical protein